MAKQILFGEDARKALQSGVCLLYTSTRRQFTLFMDAVEKLERRGIRFPLRHCCNSAGVLRYPDMHLDLVRPGIILYGLAPDGWMEGMLPLKPAMELKTVISMVKTIPAGAKVSYGRRFTADRAARIATVPRCV